MTQELYFVADEIRRAAEGYFDRGDYYQAVSEALKVARDRMREVTGNEAANKVFGENGLGKKYWPDLYGLGAPNPLDNNHRRAVGYTHLAVQFFRNELAHQVAHTKYTKEEAISYIAVANLAYLSIGEAASQPTIVQLEEKLKAIHSKLHRQFYPALETGAWMRKATFAPLSQEEQVWLKKQDMADLSLQKSFNTSNIEFMKLALVAGELDTDDLKVIINDADSPTSSMNQATGIVEFLRYCANSYPSLSTPEIWDAIQHFETVFKF